MFEFIKSFFTILKLKNRNRYLSSDSTFVGTFHPSEEKPQVFKSRSFSLFYRPQTWFLTLQAVALILVGAWTIKNYIYVFKSLF